MYVVSFIFIFIFIWKIYVYVYSSPINIITINYNKDLSFDRLYDGSYKFKENKNRLDIYNLINKYDKKCIYNFVGVLSSDLPYLKVMFYIAGYNYSIKKYCTDDNTFNYFLAWDPEEYHIKFIEQINFTDFDNLLQEEKSDNVNSDYTKSMPIYYIKQNNGMRKCFIGQIHCGTSNNDKIKVCKKINSIIETLSQEIPIIIAGEWNCFDSENKKIKYFVKMFEKLQNFKYISLLSNNINKNKKFLKNQLNNQFENYSVFYLISVLAVGWNLNKNKFESSILFLDDLSAIYLSTIIY